MLHRTAAHLRYHCTNSWTGAQLAAKQCFLLESDYAGVVLLHLMPSQQRKAIVVTLKDVVLCTRWKAGPGHLSF